MSTNSRLFQFNDYIYEVQGYKVSTYFFLGYFLCIKVNTQMHVFSNTVYIYTIQTVCKITCRFSKNGMYEIQPDYFRNFIFYTSILTENPLTTQIKGVQRAYIVTHFLIYFTLKPFQLASSQVRNYIM